LQRCTPVTRKTKKNEAEAHLEEVEAKSGPKGKYVIHINDVIEVPRSQPMKKFVVNVIPLETPIPPMEKARWSKGFGIQLPRICSVSRVESFQCVYCRGKGEKPIIFFRGSDTPFRSDQGGLVWHLRQNPNSHTSDSPFGES